MMIPPQPKTISKAKGEQEEDKKEEDLSKQTKPTSIKPDQKHLEEDKSSEEGE